MKQNVKKKSINKKTIFPLILNTERSQTHISLSNTHLPLVSPTIVKTARNNENYNELYFSVNYNNKFSLKHNNVHIL